MGLCGSVAALALLIGLVSPAAYAAEWNVAKLMALLAQNKGGHIAFTEIKYLAVLDKPLTSSGELFYKAPDYLEKRTLIPKPETFVLDGDTVTIERANKKHTLSLHDYPKIAALIESIRGTLAGDLAALEGAYRLSLDGTPQQWTLTLSPTDRHLTDIIQDILIRGEQGQVHSIEIDQADGDHSIMTIEKPGAS